MVRYILLQKEYFAIVLSDELDKNYLACTYINRNSYILSKMFDRIQKLRPNVMKKLIPLQGDVTLKNLGLTDEQQACLLEQVQVVFHCAATLRLEAKLKDAIEMNTVNIFQYLILSWL